MRVSVRPTIVRTFIPLFLLTSIARLQPVDPAAADGWLPEREVTPVNDNIEGGAYLSMDGQHTPWIVYYRKVRNSDTREVTYWTRWEGDHWRDGEKVFPNDDSWVHKPQMIFDEAGMSWLTWNRHNISPEANDIFYGRGEPGNWSMGGQVHSQNDREDYSPEIAAGGGKVWIVWYAESANGAYDVYASAWNGNAWGLEECLTSGMAGNHWFCDVDVDGNGEPHVVWSDWDGHVYYATRSIAGWTAPISIQDSSVIRAAGWSSPHIAIDRSGVIHVVWLGQEYGRAGSLQDQDVYYSRLDGGAWSAPVKVHEDNTDRDYYPEIAVASTNDIWITWHKEGSAWTEAATVWVVHFDGTNHDGEVRLDSGRFHWNQVPRIALDAGGDPWVVWGAIHGDFSESSILYSRYERSVPVLMSGLEAVQEPLGVRISWNADPLMFDNFSVERSSDRETFTRIGEARPGMGAGHEWLDMDVEAGTWHYRVVGDLRGGGTEALGPVAILVDPFVTRLAIRVFLEGIEPRIDVTMPAAGEISIVVYDVQGRAAIPERTVWLTEGSSRIPWSGMERLGNGVFWVVGRTEQAVSKSRFTAAR